VIRTLLVVFTISAGLSLAALNFYGLTQSLRPEGLTADVLRFEENDLLLDKESFKKGVERKHHENDKDYATRLTVLISNGMAHVHWNDYHPDLFHQRVPIWENYILYIIGRFSGNEEFKRYHFTIAEKSIERGVGLCGDASMLLSELLSDEGISNRIISMPGHVMVEANYGDAKQLLDPDFGVPLQQSFDFYINNLSELVREYESFGFFNNGELMIRREISEGSYTYWEGTSHFVTKKYYFERISYWLKWLLPIVLIALGLILRKKGKTIL
jgi:hypothetical protein|tara:strand:- start:999 stop:1811 length:813 start_codon:yes stop_codon:yes gene_type:complete